MLRHAASCRRPETLPSPFKLQVAKTACWQKLLADLFSPKPQPIKKTLTSALPCSSRLYAAARQIAITPWGTPTNFTGDPDLPLHDTPSEAICVGCITFHEMSTLLHRSKFIDFSIVIVASSSIGAGDDHEIDAVCFGGCTNSNYFFVAIQATCCIRNIQCVRFF